MMRFIFSDRYRSFQTELREKHDDIPWRRIIALRNRLIHDYMGINFNIVVNVLQNEIPQLSEQLKGLLQSDISKEGENG